MCWCSEGRAVVGREPLISLFSIKNIIGTEEVCKTKGVPSSGCVVIKTKTNLNMKSVY